MIDFAKLPNDVCERFHEATGIDPSRLMAPEEWELFEQWLDEEYAPDFIVEMPPEPVPSEPPPEMPTTDYDDPNSPDYIPY